MCPVWHVRNLFVRKRIVFDDVIITCRNYYLWETSLYVLPRKISWVHNPGWGIMKRHHISTQNLPCSGPEVENHSVLGKMAFSCPFLHGTPRILKGGATSPFWFVTKTQKSISTQAFLKISLGGKAPSSCFQAFWARTPNSWSFKRTCPSNNFVSQKVLTLFSDAAFYLDIDYVVKNCLARWHCQVTYGCLEFRGQMAKKAVLYLTFVFGAFPWLFCNKILRCWLTMACVAAFD